jgi:gamma-glutamyltranspeptidase/glutathione hydrolase
MIGTGSAFAAGLAGPMRVRGALRAPSEMGYVVGEPGVEEIGAMILAQGGNAVDALVATALAGAIKNPHQTGIGGYGSHGVFAFDGGKRIAALDANSTAPAAFTADIFNPDAKGAVPDRKNEHGWLAAGVPGVIAGLKLALDTFGTMSFADVLQPSIELTRDGFEVSAPLAKIFAAKVPVFRNDPGSAKLYLPGGSPPKVGSVWRNPELADVLTTLAKANSAAPIYTGDIAQRIAEAFGKNGGLVTAKDLAGYKARMSQPASLAWGGHMLHTAPLTAGGVSVLQMLSVLRAMEWHKLPKDVARTHARLEAMRLAWRDRVTLLGDPGCADVPQAKLLSDDYARECADRILAAVKQGHILDHKLKANPQDGTLSFSACDKHGNFAALTLTHGNAFGAQITIDGLGLTLGHGMSRFDTNPAHPNAPGPGKRPLNNMVPTILTRGGTPIVAVGGRGGRRIPNALFEFLTQFLIEGKSFAASMDAPRVHTEGTAALEFQKEWPTDETAALAKCGYTVKTGGSATLSAVGIENGKMLAAMR